jgi:hypothetical protein
MSLPKPKLNLPNYTQVPLYIGGTVIIATVIIGGFIYLKSHPKSDDTSSPTTVTSSPASSAQKLATSPYDGTYAGSAPVAQGISNATVTVSANKISGRGTYVAGSDIKIDLKIDGSVDTNGNVSGSFSGSQTIEGVTISGGGTYTGKINGNSASINYSATGAGQNFNGSIVLTKK